ncbi:MAG: hypothetical protein WC584_03265 [Candidatus Pacearchaeota archaeon]
MLNKNISKEEIEKTLQGKGDFVKIDHLSELLKENLPFETKKYVCIKLADIYEEKSMLVDAAKMYEIIGIAAVAFSEKMKYYVKEAELFIKAGQFERADEAMKKAIGLGNASEKTEIYFVIKEFYKKQAGVYERELRRNHAAKMYEKLLEMKISEAEREEIKEKLLKMYEKLGKVKEFFNLQKGRLQ